MSEKATSVHRKALKDVEKSSRVVSGSLEAKYKQFRVD